MNSTLKLLDLSQLATSTAAFLPRIVVAASILLAFIIGYRVTKAPLRRLFVRSAFDDTLVNLLVDHVYRFIVLVFGAVMAASQLGINVGAALAGIGIVGVALGLAAQDTLANTIAGFVIFWDKPFRVGDCITVRGKYGQVFGITLRSTRIRTQDNTVVVIPNKHIIDEVLVNHSQNREMRLNIAVTIAYEAQLPVARGVLLEAVRGLSGVSRSPEPAVVVEELTETGMRLLVRVWIADPMIETQVAFATREACKAALDAAGIEIPYPHRRVVLEGVLPTTSRDRD